MKTLLRAAAIFFVIAVAIQIVPVTRDNPPVTGTVDAPAPIMNTLRRACFDCHSNETVWPWYSRVAPASWLVAHDVHEGREHANFSTWTTLSKDQREKILRRIPELVEMGAMPPGIYTPLHPEARLSIQDISDIANWARTASLQAERGAPSSDAPPSN